MAGCTSKGQTAGGAGSDSLAADSFSVETAAADSAPGPMFLYYFDPQHMQVVYWMSDEEPERSWYGDDQDAEFQAALAEWRRFMDYRRRTAQGYTQMLTAEGSVPIRCIGELTKDPDGKDLYPGELHSRPTIPSAGMRYSLVNEKDSLRNHDFAQLHLIVHPEYMKSRHRISAEPAADQRLPKAVIVQLEKEYNMTAQRSELTYRIGDRYAYGVLQFKPKGNQVIALEVVTAGDSVFSYPVEGFLEDGKFPTWNVDDGGEYFSSAIAAAFEGPNGLELAFEHRAPESATVGMFRLRVGRLEREEKVCYHQLIDEQRPLWKKDVAALRKLYLDADPNTNSSYKLTKYRWIDIDGDGNEEIWMRDADDRHGAIFTQNDDGAALVAQEDDDRMHATFLQDYRGKGWLRIAGSAGGPSIYSQIYELERSRVTHRMTAIEVAGELEEVTLDGRPIEKSRARSYLDALPKPLNLYIYWTALEE